MWIAKGNPTGVCFELHPEFDAREIGPIRGCFALDRFVERYVRPNVQFICSIVLGARVHSLQVRDPVCDRVYLQVRVFSKVYWGKGKVYSRMGHSGKFLLRRWGRP